MIIISLLAAEQHHWSDGELTAELKDNWPISFFFFVFFSGRRALVIHFPPFSHRINSPNFTLPLTSPPFVGVAARQRDEMGKWEEPPLAVVLETRSPARLFHKATTF